jgi:flagellar biosynthetic protein FliO
MTMFLLALQAEPIVSDGELTRGVAAVGIVLALLALAVWAMKRGAFGALNKTRGTMRIETSLPLGERRSLMVVVVEGRRLLLGLTPVQVSLVAELERGASFDTEMAKATASQPDPPQRDLPVSTRS